MPDRLESLNKKKFIFEDVKMKNLDNTINCIAKSNASILITGESGTGKEVIAHRIHYMSERKQKPFIRVNCVAIPDNLIESELFGHEKGAFTGAISERKGRFELANSGTLFLDEIGDMTLGTQVKLLRVLQERNFERLGGEKTINVDIRIIAATLKNLKIEVKEGRFREDLYFRLNVIPLHIYPLRERRMDIPKLVYHFLDKFGTELSRDKFMVKDKAMEKLIHYHWCGNVRELENIMERLVVFSQSNTIDYNDLPDEIKEKEEKNEVCFYDLPFKEAKREMLKMYFVNSLRKNNWNVSKTASSVGLNRINLIRNIDRFGIREMYPDFLCQVNKKNEISKNE